MDLKPILQPKPNPRIPEFRPGDTVRVMARVVEGDRERVQAFEGVVIRRRRGGINSNFTVRRVSHGIGVERTFPLHSPRLESVRVVRVGRVRRARLYYLRERVGKKARIRAGSRDRFEEMTRQALAAGEAPPEAIEEIEEGLEEEEAPEAEAGADAEAEGESEEAPEAEDESEPEAAEEPEVEGEPEAEAAEEPQVEGETEPEEEKAGG